MLGRDRRVDRIDLVPDRDFLINHPLAGHREAAVSHAEAMLLSHPPLKANPEAGFVLVDAQVVAEADVIARLTVVVHLDVRVERGEKAAEHHLEPFLARLDRVGPCTDACRAGKHADNRGAEDKQSIHLSSTLA